MSVTYTGPWGRSAKNTKGIRTYTRGFKLQASAVTDDEFIVGSHPSLPLIGSQHPNDSSAWCVSLEVDNAWPPLGWLVTANYDSSFELSVNPIFEPAQISWDFEQYQIAAVTDRNGKGITNSAGDFFRDPVPTRDDSRPTVTVQKNVAAIPNFILSYQDTINSSAFVVDGFAIGTGKAKMQKVGVSTQQERNGFPFRTITMEMQLRRDGWDLSTPDVGYRSISATTNRVNITSSDGTSPATPVQLNGSGVAVASPLFSTVVYLSFPVYYQADFNVLPLT